ncbi:MAG TPA: histone deacetylase, partial [Methanoregulaceae archaeon]|nr:histone deacetylase [Methanoregulaceae archaeon]
MTSQCSAICGEEFTAHNMAISRETRARIENVITRLPDYVRRHPPESAGAVDLERVHDVRHIRMIEEFSSYGGLHYIDMDTYVTENSFTTALFAAGSSIRACSRALDGEHCFA